MPNPLQVLIKHQLEQRGWSYGDVARGGGISRSTVHHLATSERLAQMPQQSTLEGLAKGLGIPVAPVHRAAAEACGVNLYREDTLAAGDPEVAILIASVQKLSPVDRKHVSALVESLLRNAAAEEKAHPGP
ncbi:helix-turn-helix domain-containing protein [Streptomyces sp. NPDC059618]|uniref:helix-turn-helix domain-containing protein n=1 Tax=Streptomyces sp. NPDC059618 TaxID=3346887 RepID=UPI00369DC143